MPFSLNEGQTATMRITRVGADNSVAETVDITNPDPANLTAPAQAVIPAGADFVDVTIEAVADGVVDPDAGVLLTVGGSGYPDVQDTVTAVNTDVKSLTINFF